MNERASVTDETIQRIKIEDWVSSGVINSESCSARKIAPNKLSSTYPENNSSRSINSETATIKYSMVEPGLIISFLLEKTECRLLGEFR